MAISNRAPIEGIVVETELVFTLSELCRAGGSDQTLVLALVDEGVLHPTGSQPQDWVFDGLSLRTLRRALRLAHEFELGVAGAALVLDLLDQVDALQARLRRAGLQ